MSIKPATNIFQQCMNALYYNMDTIDTFVDNKMALGYGTFDKHQIQGILNVKWPTKQKEVHHFVRTHLTQSSNSTVVPYQPTATRYQARMQQ